MHGHIIDGIRDQFYCPVLKASYSDVIHSQNIAVVKQSFIEEVSMSCLVFETRILSVWQLISGLFGSKAY